MESPAQPDTPPAGSTAPAPGAQPGAAPPVAPVQTPASQTPALVPTPALGGSYQHDPATGTLTLVHRTRQPNEPNEE